MNKFMLTMMAAMTLIFGSGCAMLDKPTYHLTARVSSDAPMERPNDAMAHAELGLEAEWR
jgi:hypothetical protein